MSNYPPGFGSSSDLDHVYGPLEEDEVVGELCPRCGEEDLMRSKYRTSIIVSCGSCIYTREEDFRGDEDSD